MNDRVNLGDVVIQTEPQSVPHGQWVGQLGQWNGQWPSTAEPVFISPEAWGGQIGASTFDAYPYYTTAPAELFTIGAAELGPAATGVVAGAVIGVSRGGRC